MTINYTCLGKTEEMRERRYTVLTFFLKGARPFEIAEINGLPIKQVYNDLMYLRTHPLHDLPIDMVRDFGKSFFEIKISELERNLKKYGNNPSVWLGIQKEIRGYKNDLLKLQGALVDKVEHSGETRLIIEIQKPDERKEIIVAADGTTDTSSSEHSEV
jgi:hypothetical protein